MSLYEFMSDSPWLTFFLVYLVLELLLKCWRQLLRSLNIAMRGWPPAHLDADGDFRTEE